MASLSKETIAKATSLLADYIHLKVDAAKKINASIASIAEYECIQQLHQLEQAQWSKDTTLAIFQKHFLARHCFYSFVSSGDFPAHFHFNITPKGIEIDFSGTEHITQNPKTNTTSVSTGSSSFASLSRYYDNLDNYSDATAETVGELLGSFWQRFYAGEDQTESLLVLGLDAGVSWPEAVSQYRQLAQQHHPDKGGKLEDFNQIKEAYDKLKLVMRT